VACVVPWTYRTRCCHLVWFGWRHLSLRLCALPVHPPPHLVSPRRQALHVCGWPASRAARHTLPSCAVSLLQYATMSETPGDVLSITSSLEVQGSETTSSPVPSEAQSDVLYPAALAAASQEAPASPPQSIIHAASQSHMSASPGDAYSRPLSVPSAAAGSTPPRSSSRGRWVRCALSLFGDRSHRSCHTHIDMCQCRGASSALGAAVLRAIWTRL
jgi:hypothetical protein